MEYKDVRRKFVELSGRYDLVNSDWTDNGADFFINAGQMHLDRMQDTKKMQAKSLQSVAAGTTVVKTVGLRSILEVWAGNTSDGLVKLAKATLSQLKEYYEKDLSTVDQGSPAYYAPASLRPYPDSVAASTWSSFYDSSDVVLGDTHYTYDGIILMPPPDVTYYVSIYGTYYSPVLSAVSSLDTFTKLLIKGEDSYGSSGTSITDSSKNIRTLTASGDVYVDSSQYKFGAGAVYFGGTTNSYITVPDSEDWYMGTGRFTIDFQARFNSVASSQGFLYQYSSGTDYVECYWSFALGKVVFRTSVAGVLNITISKTWAPLVNTWYHIAIIRGWDDDTDKIAITVNGTILETAETISAGSKSWGDYASTLFVGYATNYCKGWLDEFRISKGIARWTENFTAPTSEYLAWTQTKSFWTESHPSLLIQAGLRQVEVFYRNTEGVKDWDFTLGSEVTQLDYDAAGEESSGINQMQG